MQRCLMAICALLLMGLLAGCGGSSTGNATFTTTASFTKTDLSGKTLYSTSATSYIAYQLDGDGTTSSGSATWDNIPLSSTGSWQLLSDGSLILSENGTPTHHFFLIQKSDTYWLVSEKNPTTDGTPAKSVVTRFFLNQTDAQNYLASITPAKLKLGGAIQGTQLAQHSAPTLATIGTVPQNSPVPPQNTGLSDGPNDSVKFNHPVGITTDGTNLYVADYKNHCIRQIEIRNDGTTLTTTIAGSKTGQAGYIDSAKGLQAQFNYPKGITVNGNYLYVADSGSNAIRRIDLTTSDHAVITIAGTTRSAGTMDGTGDVATFASPYGITSDGTNLYVADTFNHTIRKIVLPPSSAEPVSALKYTVSTVAGSPHTAGYTDGTSSSARFNLPSNITTDGSYLFVADFNNSTIRKIEIATGIVTTLTGLAGHVGEQDGAKDKATFTQPEGITTDGFYLYVTDGNLIGGASAGNTIRRIDKSTGEVKTIAGTKGTNGYSDSGLGIFYSPTGITTDDTKLYVSDSNNNVIRIVTP